MKAFGDFGFIAGQIDKDMIDKAVLAGVSDITQNRPDAEEAGQPLSLDLKAYAEEKNVAYHMVPMTPGNLTMDNVDAMTAIAGKASGKILSFCKVGGRGAVLLGLGLAGAGKATPEQLIHAAREAGHDLTSITPLLNDVASKGTAFGQSQKN